jgi:hypothetical protein
MNKMNKKTIKEERIAWHNSVFEKLGDAMTDGKLRVTRDVTTSECDWLHEDIPAGTIVYPNRHNHNLISHNGWAVKKEPGGSPFFELPLDALEAVELTHNNPPVEFNKINAYLLKRSPDFAPNGVIVKRSVSNKGYSENSINKKPPSVKLKPLDRIYVSETSYGIYAMGYVVDVHPIVEFRSVEQVLSYHAEHRLKDEAYWFNMARKLNEANREKPSVLYYQSFVVDLKLLDRVRPLVSELRDLAKIQNSLTQLDKSTVRLIRDYEHESSTELDGKIPGYLRMDLYSMFNKKAGLGTWIDVDHFVPKSVGGPGNIAENLVPVGFSLNRYKGNAIPKGLFTMANEIDPLSKYVKNVFLTSKADFLNTVEAKESARKICDVVNSWPIKESRKFYLNVMRHHHPDYSDLLVDRVK